MKIWIDARICDEPWYYGQYVLELIEEFGRTNTEHNIIVFRQENFTFNRLSFFDDIKARTLFEKEDFALMIFFDHHIPHGYKGDFIVLVESLKEVFFPKKQWLARKIYQHKLQKAITRSKKVLTLDMGTALELNEQLNVPEEKLMQVSGFFPKYIIPDNAGLNIDIKAKHNLRGEYLIYDSGNELHNNFERILKALKKLQEKDILLYIIILCEETNKDLDIRNKALEYGIVDQLLFLWTVDSELESSYYLQSSGVIFSSIYESFPFHFSKAIAYNCQIFANDIPANKNVMQSSIAYMDPLSIYNMRDCISETLTDLTKIDYSEVHSNFSDTNSCNQLKKIIQSKY